MKKKRGKSRAKKPNISFRRKMTIYYYRLVLTFKLSLLLLVGLFFFTDLFKGFKHDMRHKFYQASAHYGFVLENVIIEGQKNMPSKDIISILGSKKGDPIFEINLRGTKNKLENHIWVKAAIVERRLPSSIYIAVHERTPIAIWQFKGKLYVVDAEGNRISKLKGKGFRELIHVVGQDANIYAQSLIENLNRHPKIASKVRSAVRYGGRRWNLNLQQSIVVKMPEHGFAKAYRYLGLLNKKGVLFNQGYKMLDLRDRNKYYLEKR